ncbi:MAG: PrgI family protein [Candidatus Saccharibacteria bacterium]|nr:PrgI family protein [Candidatus Saccharibacteria bacterium]
MAIYKVPQDVEAEDKLLGPFSLKQFVFLIIAIIGAGLAWALAQIALPLFMIPLPITLFFGVLALPLRKDQPMEIYVAAIISFLMKPRVRLWEPDGVESLIEVTAPKVEEKQYGKGYSQEEVQRRLSYLASIVDSRGWAVRGVDAPGEADTSMYSDLYHEAQTATDVLADDNATARQIDALITRSDQQRRQEILNRMHQSQQQPQVAAPYIAPAPDVAYSQPAPPPAAPQQPVQPTYTPYQAAAPSAAPQPTNTPPQQPTGQQPDITNLESIMSQPITFSPYPQHMRQSVVAPLSEQPAAPATPQPNPVQDAPQPAIIEDVSASVEVPVAPPVQAAPATPQQTSEQSEEVVISLR